MRHNAYSFLIAMALLSDCYIMLAAMPMSKTEDASLEQETLNTFLNEEVAENAYDTAPSSRNPALGGGAMDKDGNSRVIVVADGSLWRGSKTLSRGLPLLRLRGLGTAASLQSLLTAERRDADQELSSIGAVSRRDTMRCMVGRVYRPCWEV